MSRHSHSISQRRTRAAHRLGPARGARRTGGGAPCEAPVTCRAPTPRSFPNRPYRHICATWSRSRPLVSVVISARGSAPGDCRGSVDSDGRCRGVSVKHPVKQTGRNVHPRTAPNPGHLASVGDNRGPAQDPSLPQRPRLEPTPKLPSGLSRRNTHFTNSPLASRVAHRPQTAPNPRPRPGHRQDGLLGRHQWHRHL